MISILKKLSKAPLFDGMSTADIELLVNCLHMYQKEYGPGEYIHYQNDTYNSIGLIVSGEVHMIGEDFWGNRNLIHVFDELQFYGEAHSMTQKPMFFNIVAIKKSVVLFINTTRIITTCTHACGAHQKLISNLMSIMSEKKLDYMHKADYLSRRTIREKVSAYLSEMARVQGSTVIQIPYNRQQLADYLAVDRSALSRELTKMQEDGILIFERNSFKLINPA